MIAREKTEIHRDIYILLYKFEMQVKLDHLGDRTMSSIKSIKQHLLHEAKTMDVAYPEQPDRLMWPWLLDVQVRDVTEKTESLAIWEHGIIFIFSTEIPPNSLVMVRRIVDLDEEPWVAIRVTSSKKSDDGKYIIEGLFNE